MNDAIENPPPDLVLKVHWPHDGELSLEGRRAIVELQFADGSALASMSVRSVLLLQAVAQKLAVNPMISLAGLVSVDCGGLPAPLPESHAIALDQLVAEAISPDMLEDEPDAARMLSEFRSRLLKSLGHVDQAIVSLAKD